MFKIRRIDEQELVEAWARRGLKKLLASCVEEVGPLDTSCLVWTGQTAGKGYGMMWWDGEKQYTHRLAYKFFKGEDPGDLQVQHLCNNPLCCNAEHLVLGTNQDNVDYMIECGRHTFGERVHNAKLTENDVREILAQLATTEVTQAVLAERYNVPTSTISSIVTGKSWRHVEGERFDGHERRKSSGFYGVVCRHDRVSKWRAHIHVDGKDHYFGSYGFEEDAAIAVNYANAYLGIDKPFNEIPEDYCAHD
jgi:hypothetical protein